MIVGMFLLMNAQNVNTQPGDDDVFNLTAYYASL